MSWTLEYQIQRESCKRAFVLLPETSRCHPVQYNPSPFLNCLSQRTFRNLLYFSQAAQTSPCSTSNTIVHTKCKCLLQSTQLVQFFGILFLFCHLVCQILAMSLNNKRSDWNGHAMKVSQKLNQHQINVNTPHRVL